MKCNGRCYFLNGNYLEMDSFYTEYFSILLQTSIVLLIVFFDSNKHYSVSFYRS